MRYAGRVAAQSRVGNPGRALGLPHSASRVHGPGRYTGGMKRLAPFALLALLPCMALLALSACGNKGPLVRPSAATAPTSQATHAAPVDAASTEAAPTEAAPTDAEPAQDTPAQATPASDAAPDAVDGAAPQAATGDGTP